MPGPRKLFSFIKIGGISLFMYCCLFATFPVEASKLAELIDYATLDHQITLETLRSGNHDPSGKNAYFFDFNIHALAVRAEDRGKAFEERLKLSRPLGRIGTINIKSLVLWQPEEDFRPNISIKGDLVRELLADAMRSFEIPEHQIAILVDIRMYEENKKFFFFGKDTFVGETKYFVIPESLPHRALTENKKLEISDTLGTYVSFSVQFQAFEARASR